MVNPKTVKSLNDPSESEHTELNANNGNNTTRQAALRDILKYSCINAIDTSAIEIVEVTAASVSSKKNSVDHSCAAGNCANTCGNVANTNVGPLSVAFCKPNDVTAGKMITPIITATKITLVDTETDVLMSRVSRGKYEP